MGDPISWNFTTYPRVHPPRVWRGYLQRPVRRVLFQNAGDRWSFTHLLFAFLALVPISSFPGNLLIYFSLNSCVITLTHALAGTFRKILFNLPVNARFSRPSPKCVNDVLKINESNVARKLRPQPSHISPPPSTTSTIDALIHFGKSEGIAGPAVGRRKYDIAAPHYGVVVRDHFFFSSFPFTVHLILW